ncbi:hypothetical protein SAMN05444412_107191 [Rhodonellum ikkaensis]|uniref:Uncharacterized protein n=1 Tax=Rhodonellum ikkaensis TaxID=336829 RepID=A0A1H3R4E0_9BACT|nr:hypothetical protein SAMN05444412_107191 [Rhodonellum ikkaensis]
MFLIKKEVVLFGPSGHKFESHGVFNPAAVEAHGKMYLLHRATNKANFVKVGNAALKTPRGIGERSVEPPIDSAGVLCATRNRGSSPWICVPYRGLTFGSGESD